MCRNVKDVCVSYYHHMKFPMYAFNGDFDEYVKFFKKGQLSFGDYWHHLKVTIGTSCKCSHGPRLFI